MTRENELIHQLAMRPKCYIKLKYAPLSLTRDMIKDPERIRTVLGANSFIDIGAVQRLEINSEREVNTWRELNNNRGGKPVESYPGTVSYTLSMERVVLYTSNYLSAMGFEEHDILSQTKPIMIQLTLMGKPISKAGGNAEWDIGTQKTWLIYGVWFRNNPMQFDVKDVNDLQIIQAVDAVASGIISV